MTGIKTPAPTDEADEDVEGHLIVDTICNQLGMDFNEWHDGFIEFYKPEKWLNSRRAACAFVASKICTLLAVAPTKSVRVGRWSVIDENDNWVMDTSDRNTADKAVSEKPGRRVIPFSQAIVLDAVNRVAECFNMDESEWHDCQQIRSFVMQSVEAVEVGE